MCFISTLFVTDDELDRAKRLLKAYETGDHSIPEEELWRAKKSTAVDLMLNPLCLRPLCLYALFCIDAFCVLYLLYAMSPSPLTAPGSL